MRRKSQVGGRARREHQLFHRPGLPRSRIAPQLFRREPIEGQVIRGMHGHQLPLKMRREFRDGKAVARQRAADLVAVGLALCRSLQIKQPSIPARDLYPFIAELGGPRCHALQTVERRHIAGKLRQKYPWSFDCSHRPPQRHSASTMKSSRIRRRVYLTDGTTLTPNNGAEGGRFFFEVPHRSVYWLAVAKDTL